jgi:hypothetical protein
MGDAGNRVARNRLTVEGDADADGPPGGIEHERRPT